MARRKTYHCRRWLATGIGVGLVGYSAHLAWEHYHDVSAPIAATVGAAMLHLAEVAWRDKERLRAVAFGLLSLLAVSISLSAALDRVASLKDEAIRARQSANLARALADKALAEARTALEAAEAAVRAETLKGGCGKICEGLKRQAEAARQRVAEAQRAVVEAGAPLPDDSGARRLAALLPVSEASIQLYQPILLPVWLELGGIALLTFGLSRPQVKRKPAAANKKRRKNRKATTPVLKAANANHLRLVR